MIRQETIDSLVHYEVQIDSCKSSGPWWQNVNKRDTKAQLSFDVQKSIFLTQEQQTKLLEKAKNRINNDWVLKITAQEQRTLKANSAIVVKKFQKILTQAFEIPKTRIPTKLSKNKKAKILDNKKKHSMKKQYRGKITESACHM